MVLLREHYFCSIPVKTVYNSTASLGIPKCGLPYIWQFQNWYLENRLDSDLLTITMKLFNCLIQGVPRNMTIARRLESRL